MKYALTLNGPLTAVHIYRRIASLMTRAGVVKQQSIGAEFFRKFAVHRTVVVEITLYLVGVESWFLGTLEFTVVLLLSER